MARVCQQLTVAQKDALILSGYTLIAGPFSSEEACLAICEGLTGTGTDTDLGTGTGTGTGSGAHTACCGNRIPVLLNATFTTYGAIPNCLEGTISMTYHQPTERWKGSGSITCNNASPTTLTLHMELRCTGSNWELQFGTVPDSLTCVEYADETYCDPLLISFPVKNLTCIADDCAACAGSKLMVVITE